MLKRFICVDFNINSEFYFDYLVLLLTLGVLEYAIALTCNKFNHLYVFNLYLRI